MNEDLVVYLGVSLGRARASFLLPNAQYHPLLQAGDFYELLELPKIMVILDGVYSDALEQQVAKIIEAGVKVYGAAALGAFLAAKLASQGMIGVGTVYQQFVDGVYESDSVLACRSSKGGDSVQRLSEPLVNIYATMEHATSGNALSASMAKIMISAAEQLDDERRTFPNIFKLAEAKGIDLNVLREFSAWVSHGGYVDQLRNDACMLLNQVAYSRQTVNLFAQNFCREDG